MLDFFLFSACFLSTSSGSGPGPDGLIASGGISPSGTWSFVLASGSSIAIPAFLKTSFLWCLSAWAEGSLTVSQSLILCSQRPFPCLSFLCPFASRLALGWLSFVPVFDRDEASDPLAVAGTGTGVFSDFGGGDLMPPTVSSRSMLSLAHKGRNSALALQENKESRISIVEKESEGAREVGVPLAGPRACVSWKGQTKSRGWSEDGARLNCPSLLMWIELEHDGIRRVAMLVGPKRCDFCLSGTGQ